MAVTAVAQEAPRGADASGCDINGYQAVTSSRTGEVLYWTNTSCPSASGSTDSDAAAAPESSGAPGVTVTPSDSDASKQDMRGGERPGGPSVEGTDTR